MPNPEVQTSDARIEFEPFHENLVNSIYIVGVHEDDSPIFDEEIKDFPLSPGMSDAIGIDQYARCTVSGSQKNGITVIFRSQNLFSFRRYGFEATAEHDPRTGRSYLDLVEGRMSKKGFVENTCKQSSQETAHEFIVAFALCHGFEDRD